MPQITIPAVDADGQPLKGYDLLDFVREHGGETIFLMFSTGKDSICSWLYLREYGKFNIIPYFLYWFPGLGWIDEALDYYEKWFGQHIIRLPLPNMFDHLRTFTYQPPERVAHLHAWRLPTFDFADIEEILARERGLDAPYTAVGFRGADNIDRRNMIIQKGAVGTGRRRHFFPVWDWNIDDIADCIIKNGIKLPKDYAYWGRTIAAWDYQMIKPIAEHFPEDYEKVVKFWMPLIDAELYRHEVVGVYANRKADD